jgi:orotate phosphoribosyltransferase
MGTRQEATGAFRARLLELLKAHAYRKGEFTLASGRKSDFFIDCKQVALRAEGHFLVGKVLLSVLKDFFPLDAVAAVAMGGCPLASAVSTVSHMEGHGIDALFIRKERKDHGTGQRIDGLGALSGRGRVAVLEDVLTTGGSLRFAVEQVLAAGHEVVAAVVLVNREEGGDAVAGAMAVPVVSIFSKRDFIDA